jgi:hypothetical protein
MQAFDGAGRSAENMGSLPVAAEKPRNIATVGRRKSGPTRGDIWDDGA